MQQTGDTISGAVAYATALFEPGTIARYLAYYRMLLQAMTADDSQPVDRLPMLSPAERQQVLYDWNTTDTDYSKQTCLHELFEAQASKTPDAVAVVYEDASLTPMTGSTVRPTAWPII